MSKKATGIVRRIDDLGRIVIPKEIRRTLRLREGEPIEIFVDKNSELILRKYSPINELEKFADEFVESIFNATGHVALVADRDSYVSAAGGNSKDIKHRDISHVNEICMDMRKSIIELTPGTHEMARGFKEFVSSYVVAPINTQSGDIVGTVVLMSQQTGVKFGIAETKLAEVAADFLGKQMDE